MKKTKTVLLVSSIAMSLVLATGISVAATISDEELNAAYDARLKANGVIMNTEGISLREQVEAKRNWYEQEYVNRVDAISAPNEVTVTDEEWNAAYDARLQANGIELNTDGMSLSEQIAAKKKWYEDFHLNQSYDHSLKYFDIKIDTDGMSPDEERAAKRDVLENWYDYL
jgi:hypothetical protein